MKRSVPLLVIATLAVLIPLVALSSSPPLPPGFTDLRASTSRVEQSPDISPDAKAAVRSQFGKIEADFAKAWAEFERAELQRQEKEKALKSEWDASQSKITTHNNNKPDSKNHSAVNAYNAEAGRLNADKSALEGRIRSELLPLQEKANAGKQKVNEWFSSPSVREFREVTQKLLSGQFKFHKGKAWNDLVNAAPTKVHGKGKPVETFEGSRGDRTDTLKERNKDTQFFTDPNTVDTRGVRKMTPEEREKELRKPRVPQKGLKIKEPPPPSGPSTTNEGK